MNRSVLDRQMFRYGGSVPMQDGGIASLPQEMPMEAPMEPSPEMMEEMEMQQLRGAAMEQGVEPDVLEDTLAQHAESFARMDEAEDYETVINEIRGDELPISARYEELADMVGPEDAQATPESVLTLVQPVIQLASIDQGIGGLAAEEMMDVPVEGPMAEGIMSTIDMQGAEQEAVPSVNFKQGGAVPPVQYFNQGGAVPPVQYFNQGGVGAIPKIDLRTVPGMQNYSRAAGQMGTYDFSGKRVGKTIPRKDISDIEAQIKKDASMDKVAAPQKLGTPDIPSQTTSAPSGNALEEPRTTAPSEFSYENLLDPEAEQAAIDRQKKLNKSQLLFAMSKGFGNIASGRGSLATRLSQGLDHVFGTMSSQASSLKALKDSQEAARMKLKKEELDAERKHSQALELQRDLYNQKEKLQEQKDAAKLERQQAEDLATQKLVETKFGNTIEVKRLVSKLAHANKVKGLELSFDNTRKLLSMKTKADQDKAILNHEHTLAKIQLENELETVSKGNIEAIRHRYKQEMQKLKAATEADAESLAFIREMQKLATSQVAKEAMLDKKLSAKEAMLNKKLSAKEAMIMMQETYRSIRDSSNIRLKADSQLMQDQYRHLQKMYQLGYLRETTERTEMFKQGEKNYRHFAALDAKALETMHTEIGKNIRQKDAQSFKVVNDFLKNINKEHYQKIPIINGEAQLQHIVDKERNLSTIRSGGKRAMDGFRVIPKIGEGIYKGIQGIAQQFWSSANNEDFKSVENTITQYKSNIDQLINKIKAYLPQQNKIGRLSGLGDFNRETLEIAEKLRPRAGVTYRTYVADLKSLQNRLVQEYNANVQFLNQTNFYQKNANTTQLGHIRKIIPDQEYIIQQLHDIGVGLGAKNQMSSRSTKNTKELTNKQIDALENLSEVNMPGSEKPGKVVGTLGAKSPNQSPTRRSFGTTLRTEEEIQEQYGEGN